MFICLLFTIRDTPDRLYGCMYHVYTGSPSYKVYCTRIRPHRKAKTKSYHIRNTLISEPRSCGIPNTLSSPAVASVTSSRSPPSTGYSCFHRFSSFSQFQLFWDKTTPLVIPLPIVIVRQFRGSRLQRLHSILVQRIPRGTLPCSPKIQSLKMAVGYISQSMP